MMQRLEEAGHRLEEPLINIWSHGKYMYMCACGPMHTQQSLRQPTLHVCI